MSLQRHFSSMCTSQYRCRKCEGHHHTSICLKETMNQSSQNSWNHLLLSLSSHPAQNLLNDSTQNTTDHVSQN